MKYTKKKLISKIDEAVEKGESMDYFIDDTNMFLDILEHYRKSVKINWPSHIISLDAVNTSVIINELKTHIAEQINTEKTIEFIENYIKEGPDDSDIDSKREIDDQDQLVDILEHFENKYDLKIPMRLLKKITIEDLADELWLLYKNSGDDRFIIIYCKLSENKQTKEVALDGPFFGEKAETKEEIENKARELVNRQQSNALLIKIYEKDGRTDSEIMDAAKKHFAKIYEDMSESYV